MKKTIALMAFAALGTLTMYSCKKKDNNNSSSTGSITATVNGASFSGARCTATIADSILNISGENYSGSTIVYPVMSLTIYNYNGIGTYPLDQAISLSTPSGTATVDSSSSSITATSNTTSVYGTITITATTPNIKGTFSFTTEDSTKVTNGSFTAAAL
jgi:hypothetical protein